MSLASLYYLNINSKIILLFIINYSLPYSVICRTSTFITHRDYRLCKFKKSSNIEEGFLETNEVLLCKFSNFKTDRYFKIIWKVILL